MVSYNNANDANIESYVFCRFLRLFAVAARPAVAKHPIKTASKQMSAILRLFVCCCGNYGNDSFGRLGY
jgi:hypothetical protein